MDFYLSGDGRVSLGQYWLKWLLPVIGFWIVYGAVISMLGLFSMEAYMAGQIGANTFMAYLPGLVLIWPTFAVGAKRLHDIGWNGWLMILVFVPLANLVIFVVTWFIPGNRGENRYGPEPG